MTEANKLEIVLALKGLQAVHAGVSSLRSAFGSLQSFFGTLGITVGAAAAAAAATKMMHSAVDTAAEMHNLAQKVGMTTEEISGLTYSAKMAELSQDDLTKASKALATQMRETGRGSDSIYEEFLRLSDQFAAMPDGATKAAIAVEKFGRSGMDMIPWMNQGSAAIRSQIADAERLGKVVGSDFASNADNFKDSLDRIKAAVEGSFAKLASKVLPVLLKLLERLNELLDKINASINGEGGIVSAFSLVSDSLRLSVTYLGTLMDTLKKRGEEAATSWTGKLKLLMTLLLPATAAVEALKETVQNEAFSRFKNGITSGLDLPKPNPKPNPNKDRVMLTAEDLARERGALDVRIKENALITEKYKLAAQNRSLSTEEINSLRTQLSITEQLVEEQRQLTADYLQSDFVTAEEARKLELEDKKALLEIEKERLEYQYDPNSIADQMESATEKMLETWGTFAEQVGATFTDVINVGIDSIANNLTNVIMLTQTWSQALHNIGMSFLQEIIRSIIRMAAQWVVSHVIMKTAMVGLSALGDLLRAKDAAKTMATEGSKAPLLAVNAVNASTSSYGVASIVGLALAVAAIGAVVAAAMGAFKEGGYTGAGDPNAIAGIVHRGEFVMPATTVNRVGLSALETIKKTGEMPVAGGSNVNVEGHKVSVAVLDSRNQIREFLETAEGESMIIDVARRRRTEIGINT